MPDYTPELGLIKPSSNEAYNIAHHNQNADIIEEELLKRLLATDYTANDVLAKIKTVDGSGSGLDADTVDGKHATAFATEAQGANADDLISGAKSAYNALRLGNKDALSYAEKVYVREYLGTRGGDSVIFNEIAYPGYGEYWGLENVDPLGGGTIDVLNEEVGEIECQLYFNLTYYDTPRVRIGIIDQDIKPGDKIFISFDAKVVDGSAANSALLFGADESELVADMQLTDTYKRIGLIFTVTNEHLNYSSGLISFKARIHPVSGLGYGLITLMLKSPIAINLTRSFGSTYIPTIEKVRGKLLAFDNSFFWASAPVYSLIEGIKSRVSTLETNTSLFASATFVTWQSTDRVWHDKPNGIYYVASDGTTLGYPSSFVSILQVRPSENVVTQVLFGGALAIRRFNRTQSMDWIVK